MLASATNATNATNAVDAKRDATVSHRCCQVGLPNLIPTDSFLQDLHERAACILLCSPEGYLS